MRGRGINYDTGFLPGGHTSRESFDPETVREEMRVIAGELNCTAVRITGGDPERIGAAARHAADAGLEVWFSPFPCELTTRELGPFFAECAERAEDLRRDGAEVVLVTGCELSFFAAGFLPGEDFFDRISRLGRGDPETLARFAEIPGLLNPFLAGTAEAARKVFGGRVTYASGDWEDVDWGPFDVVAVNAYRDERTAGTYREDLRSRFRHGRPVAVTEFGTCAYTGAGARGGMAWAIVDDTAQPPRLNGDYLRDEGEQVRYLRELLTVFEEEGVDTAFWFTFAGYNLPHHPEPRRDLDLASYGVVRVLQDGRREPKEVFGALAAAYAAS
ncbi:hypothetical protein [Microbispora triticiradicis]|uniref:hypothetical protein n=1 Tax=Microbispora triticiradicis TaxID=2200763 RepID=UPI001AD7CCFE|nr:hypothetical protein [Microbispora triticiradicis]MBO4270970.1 hypothetical protein [Microbispora triticiradicis]